MGYGDDDFSSESMSHSDENMSDGARGALTRMLKTYPSYQNYNKASFSSESKSQSIEYLSYGDITNAMFSRIMDTVKEKHKKNQEIGIVSVMPWL